MPAYLFARRLCNKTNGTKVIDLSASATDDTGSINLPKTNAYAEEIKYFINCVQQGTFPEKVKPEELLAVIRILNNKKTIL